jgi:hypothetical protein
VVLPGLARQAAPVVDAGPDSGALNVVEHGGPSKPSSSESSFRSRHSRGGSCRLDRRRPAIPRLQDEFLAPLRSPRLLSSNELPPK